jgi:beta-carotene ketolase (CrtW type)
LPPAPLAPQQLQLARERRRGMRRAAPSAAAAAAASHTPPPHATHTTRSAGAPAAAPPAPLPAWSTRPDYTWRGVGVAAALICTWAAVQSFALFAPPPTLPLLPFLLAAAALFAALTWLYVGLFITAHDAMHALVAPRHRRLNDAFGATAVCLYAQFSFAPLLRAHGAHHRAPGTPHDPDFHDGVSASCGAWLRTFMLRYVRAAQLARIALLASLLHFGARVPARRLALFWALPSILRRACVCACACACVRACVCGREESPAERHCVRVCAARCSCFSSARSCRTARPATAARPRTTQHQAQRRAATMTKTMMAEEEGTRTVTARAARAWATRCRSSPASTSAGATGCVLGSVRLRKRSRARPDDAPQSRETRSFFRSDASIFCGGVFAAGAPRVPGGALVAPAHAAPAAARARGVMCASASSPFQWAQRAQVVPIAVQTNFCSASPQPFASRSVAMASLAAFPAIAGFAVSRPRAARRSVAARSSGEKKVRGGLCRRLQPTPGVPPRRTPPPRRAARPGALCPPRRTSHADRAPRRAPAAPRLLSHRLGFG